MTSVIDMLLLTTALVLLPAATSSLLNETALLYAVTVSSQVTGGASETLCAHVVGATEPVALTVTLDTESGSTAILEETVNRNYYHCKTFKVPKVENDMVSTVNVTVRWAGGHMNKKSKVLISPPTFINIIQTDKPLYKPGQTVRFRIVSLDAGFIPYNHVYKTVELQDPNKNRIAQWLDQTPVSGVVDLSHRMSSESTQGSYVITAWTDKGEEISHSFDIKEYVLPKYEVLVRLPKVINILQLEVPLRICGRYTYGKPVLGSIKAVVCRRAYRYFYWFSYDPQKDIRDICETAELETDKTGCASHSILIMNFAPMKTNYEDVFEVEAEMKESGTGVVMKGSGQTTFTADIRTLVFENVAVTYKPGIPFEGKVKLTGPDLGTIGNEAVHLFVNAKGQSYNVSLLTDDTGEAAFSLETSSWKDHVSVEARSSLKAAEDTYVSGSRQPQYRSAYLSATPFYSKSKSFVKVMQSKRKLLCGPDVNVRAEYIVQGEELKKEQDVLHFYYIVMSKGRIVQHGQLPVTVKEGTVNKGEVSVPLRQLNKLSPYAQVAVYTVMPSGEAVADSQDFPIDICFSNKVSLGFSSLQALPGEKTSMSLESHPGSLCSVRAVDQSVLLLQPDKELTADSVYSQLPVHKLSGYNYQVEDYEQYPCFPTLPVDPPMIEEEEEEPFRRKRRSVYYEPNEKNDVYSVFKEIGIKIVTNSDVKKPYECFDEVVEDRFDSPVAFMEDSLDSDPQPKEKKSEEIKKTVRSFFPETWIWDLLPVGDSGSVSVEKTVPDTITKWAASAFCTSSAGFGLAPNIMLVAFQPFFVSLTLPYSVIRGEEFTLKATVFNYLPSCIMVKIVLSNSTDYSSRECGGCQYMRCLCGEESMTFDWLVTPRSLGKVSVEVSTEALETEQLCGNEVATVPKTGSLDTVIRKLLVEAEGVPETITHNALLCPKGGPVVKDISLQLPEMFVAGSARASVSILGDIMGRAMKNLDKLLAMPYGCGEQNMVLFAPNIYILNYLSSTGQLTAAIRERATSFLESGYQRELNYKHNDGSYSAFGKSDQSGNTWLTSFVMKSFGGARPYIFIDPKHILDAEQWLASHQGKDGCINSVGKLFHNGMKGGVSDDVSLTAYITAALLELKEGNATGRLMDRCLVCLRTAVAGQLDNMYTTALLSYTFSLAGEQETRAKLLTHLHQRSSIKGGLRHWSRADGSEKRLDSLEVEVTSYVLLALLHDPPLPAFSLDYASSIVRWLAGQQNAYGGFSSTQDTVVALQALARYGATTYHPEGASTVTVTSLGGAKKQFTVAQSNRLLYQEEPLPDVPGEYKVTAEGKSCVLAQVAMHYNIPPPEDFTAFHIAARTLAKCNATRPQLILSVDVRYQGRREDTNMVIINIKLLSGYALETSSLLLLKSDPLVKRVDVEEGYINIYLDSLSKDTLRTFTVMTEEEVAVRNLKPAVVKVYDYYQISDEAVTDYTSPCAESDNEL